MDLRDADVVFAYLLQDTNDRLKDKLRRELRPGTRIIANTFVFPGLPLVAADEELHLYLYNSNKAHVSLYLSAGYYGQHRFEAITTKSGLNLNIGKRQIKLVLAPESLSDITFTITRHAYEPVSDPLNLK